MTPPASVPTPRPKKRPELHRRVKRGVVAGYLHGLSPRHRAGGSVSVPAAAEDHAAAGSARDVRR